MVVGLGVGGFFAFAGSGGSKAAAVSSTSSATPSASASASASTQAEPATTCSYTASGTAARNVGLPPAKPDYKAGYQATIHTNRGDVVIALLNSKATCTVNSFVYLAAKKYFNNTSLPPCDHDRPVRAAVRGPDRHRQRRARLQVQ